ncbi:hypothetical protein BGW42_005920 [Actinomortierella wolfii]|nr:hypothetical protein BGW42_005920 [Actinomortierella wolfii]
MPRLHLECIARVVKWVDNPQGLFNLLTVSKDVFLIAVRCLYHDPLKSHTYPDEGRLSDLVLFLLSLSPPGSNNIDVTRQSKGLPRYNQKPMLDYLSLVKVIRWRFPSICNDPLCSVLRCPNDDIYSQLTWAFVGHRLGEVEELEIQVGDHERYLYNAAKMTRLRKIWVRIGEDMNYKDMYNFAEAMVKAIQLHHGLNQLSECHMIPNLVQWFSGASSSPHEIDISVSGVQKVYSLLPSPRHYLTLPRPDGSTVLLNHPFDPYAATIESMWTIDDSMWQALMKMYPGHSHSEILQRLRGMTALDIPSMTANGNDENVLAWAACEAEHYCRQPGGHQLRPLVPLETLTIDYEGRYGVCALQTGTATPKWKILQDGLLGFSGTLKSLQVTYPQSNDEVADRLFIIPRPLPKLVSLTLYGLTVDRSVWEQAPNIEDLKIDVSFQPLRDSIAASIYSQDGQNTGTSTRSSTLVDTPQRRLPEIWFRCPKLTQLILSDRAFNLLDPESLHFSPNLHSLDVFCSKLHHFDANHRFPLRVKGILDALLDKNNDQMLPFTHSSLLSISFFGYWEIEVDELHCLLQVLSGLWRIDFGSVHFTGRFGARELIEITKTHSSLLYVSTEMKLATEPPASLGLSGITYNQVEEMSSIVSDGIMGEFDSKLPEKRSWIMYGFLPSSYALYLQ